MVGNALSELPRVTRWIHAWAAEHQVPPETADRLDLCSTELVTNIVSHAYDGDGGDRSILLRLRRDGEVLRLEIEDDGKPFNPLDVKPPEPPASLEEARVGGSGVAIVRRVSDGLHYERVGGRNRCTVFQRCTARVSDHPTNSPARKERP